MRSLFSRLFGFASVTSKARKVVREKLLLCERLEARDVPATILMYPGSDAQTQFLPVENGITLGGNFLTTRDVHGQVIDFNHDGNPDAINFGFELTDPQTGGQKYLVASTIITPLLSNGSGLFTYTSVNTFGYDDVYAPGCFLGAVVDYNGDGYQDIIGFDSQSLYRSFYYRNRGDGTFVIESAMTQQYKSFKGGEVGTPVAMADFNNDGALDVLLPSYRAIGSYTLLNGTLSSGKWTGQFNMDLTAAQTIDPGNVLPNPDNSGTLQNNLPLTIDLNNDGFLDIVTQGPTGLRVFANDGAGVFSSHIDIDSADQKYGLNLVAGDFNKDGKIDIASTPGRFVRIANTGIGQLSVYINNTATAGGTPTFAPAVGYFGADPLSTMAVADFNLDGNLDIAVAIVGLSDYRILQGNGNGGFGTPQLFSGFQKVGAESGGIGAADWNNDGQIDVAMGARYQDYGALIADTRYNQALGVSINGTFTSPGMSPTTLATATVGQPYSQTISFTGGDASLAYNLSVDPTSNPLPPGLSIVGNTIQGTPTRNGPFQVLFRVNQPNGLVGSTLAYLRVNPGSQGVLIISPATLPNVSLNQVVSQQLATMGGTGTIQYAVSSGILPAGLSLSGTGLISGVVSATGTFNFTVSATDGNGSTGFRQYTVVSTAAPLVPVMQAPCIVAGASAGNQVTIFNADGTPRARFRPFSPAFKGGVNVAQGDITGDGVADLVVSVAHGAGPIVSVFDGRSLALVKSFTAYVPNFTGGVHVAAGDVDGDGRAEVITGAGPGEFSRVKVFNGTTGTQTLVFFAFAQGYKGGVTVAAGDVNGDGRAEIIAGSLTNSRSIVRVFNGSTGGLLSSILPYAASFTGGVTVAAGDINGDGKADIVVGTAAGIAGTVKVYNGANNALLKTLTPYAPGYTGGVSVSAADLNGDQKADIVTGTMQANIRPVVKAFSGANYAQIDSFFAYSGMVGVSVAAR